MQIVRQRGYWYVILSILFLLSLFASQTKITQEHYDQAAERALVVFVTARGINAVISVIQDTDVSITPAGVGVSTSPGELLDPLNDMVERLSWIMLGASIALKIQGYVMGIMDGQTAAGVLVVLFVLSLISIRTGFKYLHPLILKIFIMTALIQLVMPTTFFLHHLMHAQLFTKPYETAQQSLQGAKTELEQYEQSQVQETKSTLPSPEQGVWWEQPLDWLDRQYQGLEQTYVSWSFQDKLSQLKQNVDEWISQMLELATQFIMTTLLLPFLMLWLFYRLSAVVFQYDFRKISPDPVLV